MTRYECSECLELWGTYLQVATEHAGLSLRQQLAAEDHDLPAYHRLQPEIAVAEGARLRAKRRILNHNAECHSVGMVNRHVGSFVAGPVPI